MLNKPLKTLHIFLQMLVLTSMLLSNINITQAANITCESLNKPDEVKDYVVSILEEALGNENTKPTDPNETIVLTCFRQTTCKQPTITPTPGAASGSGSPATPEKPAQSTKKPPCDSLYVTDCKFGTGISCQRVQAFFAKSGSGLLYAYIGSIYRWSATTVGLITVFVIIINAIIITTAGENSGAIDEAKGRIVQSLAGLALLFASAVILYTINPTFFKLF